jgi:uncharacterized protein (UPF0264 family)
MRLLVSVRAEDEVAEALAGGADIIDAKEPAHGSLGAVSPEVLRGIAARLPPTVPLSVALGDFTAPDAVRHAVAAAAVPRRRATTYVKLGFAGERSEAVVTSLVVAALDSASATSGRPIVVPVAYADHTNASSPPPEILFRAALEAGARAFLIDTCSKNGRGLLEWISLERLRALSASARSSGLLLAIAGSLDSAALDRVAGMADVVGVRGAACRGGREGRVDAVLVQRLRERLGRRDSLPPAERLLA